MNRRTRGDALRLADIVAATHRIKSYISDGEAEFLASEKTQDAVIRQLEIIGEAAGHVSERVRTEHPEIPWRGMRGFASFAKHEYWRMEIARLWNAAVSCEKIGLAARQIRAD